MEINELQQVQLLSGFPEPQGDLLDLLVHSGLRIGPKLTTASALDGSMYSPKIKVKGKVSNLTSHIVGRSFYVLLGVVF